MFVSASKGRRNSELVQREIENGKQLVQKTKENDVEAVRRLLRDGVSVDAAEYNRFLFYKSQNYMTPLQVASKHGHTELVRMFSEQSREDQLNARDRFDTTAVHLAAENGHTECLRLLLGANAECNPETKYSKQGSYQDPADQPSSDDSDDDHYSATIRRIFPFLHSDYKVRVPNLFGRTNATSDVPYTGGSTPLHLATKEHHQDCIEELILNGADYNAVDEKGQTSLYIAAELGYEDAVLLHLRSAVGRDILSLPIKNTGQTPLHECVRHGLLSCIDELLQHGSDVNHRNTNGFSPLHLALHNTDKFSMDILKALVVDGYNTDVNMPDKSGYHPLQYVCFHDNAKQERRPAAAAFLIAYGAQYSGLRNKHGMSVLQNELQSITSDFVILQAIVKTMPKLPSLETIGVMFNGNHMPAQLQEKCDWYRSLFTSPRSLQHYCRCILRTALGTKRLKRVRQLPLPNPLKDYVLLEYDEYR